MRLPDAERDAIVAAIAKFDTAAEIFLFGSRVDDSKRGGDIDILIKSDILCPDMMHLVEDELFRHIEEQKIDFVLTRKDNMTVFAALVLSKGAVQLCPTKS